MKTRAGEVDLVALDGIRVVCLEVKTGRVGTRFRPLDRVDRARLRRLHAQARLLSPERGPPARVDLLEVGYRRGEGRARLRHLRDVPRPP